MIFRGGAAFRNTAHQSAHQKDRQEHGDQREGDRDHGEPHLAGAATRRFHGRQAILHVAGNILEHDDRVVHHEAGGDGQRHQGKIVERKAQQIHHAERADDGDRHGNRRDHGGAAIAQEHVDHGDHEQDGDDQRALGIVQRGPDGDGAVGRIVDVDPFGHRCRHARDRGAHAGDGGEDVGAGLAEHDDENGGLGVGQAEVAQVLHRIGDLADIAQVHRIAVAVADDQILVVVGLVGLVVGIDLPALRADIDVALRRIGVGAAECRAHILEPDAVMEQRLRIELNPHRRRGGAANDYLADAGDLQKLLLQHRTRRVVDLAAGEGVGGE